MNTPRKINHLTVRSTAEPTLSKRHSNNNKSIRYNCLNYVMFMDMLLSKIKSRCINSVCQVFTTKF